MKLGYPPYSQNPNYYQYPPRHMPPPGNYQQGDVFISFAVYVCLNNF